MMRQFELVERVKSYDPQADEDVLNRAYVYAMKMHGSQLRASGDPYFSHPIEVAGILTELKLDADSIVTALLHDVVEDTEATLQDIEKLFGKNIARLVDGVTKLGKLELQSEQERHAENFRKRRRIARETMDIYAPLAERIGMHNFKDQLEDLAFAQLNEDARESMVTRLNFLEEQGENLTSKVIDELTRVLAEDGVEAWVSGRIKTPYSVWRKMQRKNVTFEQLSDIVAFRVVVKDVQDCYRALGVLHSRFPVVPGRFKDYVSTPKPNGYKSIHTGLIGPSKQRVEVQIRTSEMHEQAEYGVAAHWIYKQTEKDGGQEGKQYRWLRELLDILDQTANPEEFLEHTKMEMFQDQVFCFSPEIGDRCVGARVNGRMVPLRTPLENGDQVEIITSKAQTPSPDWENFVVSGKAKARVRRFVRLREREQYAELGRNILEKQFRQEGYDLTEKALQGVIKKFKIDHVVDLHSAVGQGVLTAREVLYAVYPGAREQDKAQKIVPIARARAKAKGKGRQAKSTSDEGSGTGAAGRGPHQGSDTGHGAALRPLLPSAAWRPYRGHRHHWKGRDGSHDRLRNAGILSVNPGTLGRSVLGHERRGRVLHGPAAGGAGQRTG